MSIQPNTTVTVGDTVTIFCLVEGTHAPSVSWTPSTGNVGAERSNVIGGTILTNFTLNLTDVILANTGTYSCTARNMYKDLHSGSDTRSFYLYVQSKDLINV